MYHKNIPLDDLPDDLSAWGQPDLDMTSGEARLHSDQLIRSAEGFHEWLFSPRENAQVAWYLNPYTLHLFEEGQIPYSPDDRVVADGRLMARTLRQLEGGRCISLHFDYSGVAGPVFDEMAKRGTRLAVVGGAMGEVEAFREILLARHPGLKVVYVQDGFFGDAGRGAVIRDLILAEPDVVLVAKGSPRQETFSQVLKRRAHTPMAIVTCGGFISQTAARPENFYPKIFVTLNMRWLYRIYREPHVYARVMQFYLPFMAKKKLGLLSLPIDHLKRARGKRRA